MQVEIGISLAVMKDEHLSQRTIEHPGISPFEPILLSERGKNVQHKTLRRASRKPLN